MANKASVDRLAIRREASWIFMSPTVLRLTLLALAFAALSSWVVWARLSDRKHQDLVDRFEFEGAEIVFRIEERFRAYHQVLRGARGLYAASMSIERDEWREYAQMLRLEDDYAGIQGLGFARWLLPEAVVDHEARVRAEGFAAYRIWPEGERDAYAPIRMLEPVDWRNQRALGYDMFSEPVRREAMMRAVATGEGALSGKVKLVQETEQYVQAGVLLYLPVFVNGAAIDTEERRWAALFGWVFSPFRMNDLIAGTVQRFSPLLRIRIFDDRIAEDALLFDSHSTPRAEREPVLERSITLDLNGRNWVVVMSALPGYRSDDFEMGAEIAAILSVGLMFVLATWSFTTMRERALAMQRAATHDPLTGVPNRLLFGDLLARAISTATRYGEGFGLLFVDLDRFKEVNDECGHEAGDALLVAAVERMHGCLRASDSLARQGGDEFVILLPRITTPEDLRAVADKILEALAQPFRLGGASHEISASIGIVRFPEHGRDADTLLKRADQAMYAAKANGRNQCRIFDMAAASCRKTGT